MRWWQVMALVAVGVPACGEEGSYVLRWKLDGETIRTARDCTARGVGSIRVTAYDSAGAKWVRTYPCFPPEHRGPDLPDGTYDLQVEGLGLDGQTFVDPDSGTQYASAWVRGVRVEAGKETPAQVDLTSPPACLDGVDNDGDGLPDAADPGCWARDEEGNVVRDGRGAPVYTPTDTDESE